MAFIKLRLVPFLISLLITVSGCVGPGNSNNSAQPSNTAMPAQNQAKANSSSEELGLLINFTLEPEDLVWREDKAKKTLIAVMRFDAEDTKKLADQLARLAPGSPYTVRVDDWFPAEIVAQGEASGRSTVEGMAFPADDFYQDPYTKGVVVRINDSDFFVIELAARQ